MKILVTGGLGFIGHNVVAQLEALGHEVVITDNKTTYGIIPQEEIDYLITERRKKVLTDRIYGIDIANGDSVDWLVKSYNFDAIIHLASFPRQKVVNANPAVGSKTMSEGLLNLLEASVKHNVNKFVYVSSSMVYGDFKDTYFDGVDETHQTKPLGQYGIMKLAGEWLVQDYSRRTSLKHTIIRPSAVYGPLDVEDRVVAKFMLAAMRNETLKVNGANETLDFTYVDDAAKGIVDATVSNNTDNKIYNLTRGESKSLLEAAELAVKIAGQGTIEVKDKDLNFPSRGALNTLSARQDFGFDPKVDVEEGFQRYYDWLASSPFWAEQLSK